MGTQLPKSFIEPQKTFDPIAELVRRYWWQKSEIERLKAKVVEAHQELAEIRLIHRQTLDQLGASGSETPLPCPTAILAGPFPSKA